MKRLVFIAIICANTICYSQDKIEKTFKEEIGCYMINVKKTIYPTKNDSSYYAWFGFIDQGSTTEAKKIELSTTAELNAFVSDLKLALPEISKEGNEFSWDKKIYILEKSKYLNRLFVFSGSGGVAMITKWDVQNIIYWLSTF